MVTQFYADVARLPQISDQDMCTFMQQLSIQQNDEFDTIAALKELYIYVTTYKEQVCHFFDIPLWEIASVLINFFLFSPSSFIAQIIEALETDVNCKKLHLANKLENVGVTIDGMDDC